MLAAALALAGGTLFSTSRYVRSESIDKRRDAIVNWYRSITIEDIAGFFESLPDIFEGNVISDPTEEQISAAVPAEDLEDYMDIFLPTEENLINISGFVENYGKKNDFRMKPFHHLDIGVQFIKPHKKNNGQSIFEISIYNVYNHHNPFFYFTEQDYVNGQARYTLKQVSIFPIIPTFTYHFKF